MRLARIAIGRSPLARTALALALAALLLAPARPALAAGFAPGEEIDFTVDFLGIKMGEGKIVVGQPEGTIWPVIAQGRSGGLASIVDVREHWVSYWDSETLLPRGSDLRALELGDRHDDRARFDREAGKATIRITRKGVRDEQTYPLDPRSHDFASAMLWLRTQKLSEGARFDIPVFTKKGTFTLVATVTGRETLSTKAGTFDCWRVQARTAFDGKFETKRDVLLYYSADENQVPVRISAEFSVGTIVVHLAGYRAGGQLAKN
jgi:hypothetical protein